MRRATVYCVLNEYLPAVRRGLQGVEVECDKVIEEEAFDLTTKNVQFASDNVEGVPIAAGRARTCGEGSRPLLCRCDYISTVSLVLTPRSWGSTYRY